jgi:2,4-dienoyl-CoA reductase-like NADH-dependent reductase (Old Yellow Enzyme family)
MATYYAQRAEAGLIISEAVGVSPNGLGYARIPGLYNQTHAVPGARQQTPYMSAADVSLHNSSTQAGYPIR